MATCKKCGVELTEETKCECGADCCKGCAEDKTCCSDETDGQPVAETEESTKTE